MDFVEVKILNWEKYNPRRDYKKPWWFALSNTITSDGMFCEFSDAEFRAWIHILCTASVQNKDVAQVFIKQAERSAGIKRKILLATIDKLEILKVIQIPARSCTDSVQDPYATLQDRTEQDKQDSTVRAAARALHPLAVVWNSNRGDLGEVKEVGKERSRHIAERLKECPDLATWAEVTRRLAASDFCNGRVDGKAWKATFDFLLRPKTRIKALEGAYDNFNGATDSDNRDLSHLPFEEPA